MKMLPFWAKGLTPDMAKVAESELGENNQRRIKALQEFKTLIEGERGFSPLQDDEFLTRFLRAKKYDVHRAFKTYKNYYSYKAQYSGRITDLLPQDLSHVLELNKVFIPPNRGASGEGIIMAFMDSREGIVSVEDHLAAFILSCEIGMETDASQVCGSSAIFDFQNVATPQLIRYCNPAFISILTRGAQGCWPYRINVIHIVNEPSYFTCAYNLIKQLLTKKMRERIYLHGTDLSSLTKHFHPENLPKCLGGVLGEREFVDFRQKLFQNAPLMKRINTYVYRNKKYPKNNTHTTEADQNVTARTLFDVSSS